MNNFRIVFVFFAIVATIYLSSCKGKNASDVSARESVELGDVVITDYYDDSTKMITDQVYLNDSMRVLKTYYFRNGQIYMVGDLINDVRDGEWKAYSEDGHLLTVGSYKNGLDHGLKTVYFENGNIRYQGNFENGKKVGIWKFYTKDGKLAKELDLSLGQVN